MFSIRTRFRTLLRHEFGIDGMNHTQVEHSVVSEKQVPSDNSTKSSMEERRSRASSLTQAEQGKYEMSHKLRLRPSEAVKTLEIQQLSPYLLLQELNLSQAKLFLNNFNNILNFSIFGKYVLRERIAIAYFRRKCITTCLDCSAGEFRKIIEAAEGLIQLGTPLCKEPSLGKRKRVYTGTEEFLQAEVCSLSCRVSELQNKVEEWTARHDA